MEQGDRRTAAIDAAMKVLRQGDCFLGPHLFVHRFDPGQPNTPEAKDYQSGSVNLVEVETDGLIIVSQTCDIVRSCVGRPFLSVSPLIVRGDFDEIKKGRKPQFAYVPGVVDRQLVADLDRIMTIEKGFAAKLDVTPGCRTPEEARALSTAFSRKFARFAFPDDFHTWAGKLVDRLVEKHDRQTEEGKALRALREVRVLASPSWNSPEVEVHFFFVRQEEDLTFQEMNWAGLLDKWLDLIPTSGRFSGTGAVYSLRDITAWEYVASDPLDLDHLSGP